MTEWIWEAGIGETRAALVEDGAIVEALIELDDGGARVGAILPARLAEAGRSPKVTLDDGGEAMLDRLPPGLSIGAALTVEIAREAVPERGRPKLAKARVSDERPRPAPDVLARITASGLPVRRLHAHESDALEAAGWSELLEEAERGEIAFSGGAVRMSVTPAMTLFDIDGDGAPAPLALAGAAAVARAIRRFGIGGSIGIDFPTLAGKAERAGVDAAIDARLPPPFERTATNGFGFLQIVRPRPRASLPELLAADPAGRAARALLRRLERTPPPGPAVERVPARVLAALRPEWIVELHRRTGTATRFEAS